MEKRMLKSWSKITGKKPGKLSPEVFIDTELTRGVMKKWRLHTRDREDADDWMPVMIVAGPKVVVYYAFVNAKNSVAYNKTHLTLAIYDGKCDITEYNGMEFTVTPVIRAE
jgi:hypothetical protein|tara:strand:+ start:3844 stop:4176 length:333 start_codon:yes stop_codon:yes gene_type:complete